MIFIVHIMLYVIDKRVKTSNARVRGYGIYAGCSGLNELFNIFMVDFMLYMMYSGLSFYIKRNDYGIVDIKTSARFR